MYCLYGNKGNYGMVSNSSVGQYANRSYVKSPVKIELSHFNVVVMEEIVTYNQNYSKNNKANCSHH